MTASILLTPEPTEVSISILNKPIFAVLETCVPPHNSTEKSPTRTTLTTSPYFSSNKAVAPALMASSLGISLTSTSTPLKIYSLTISSTAVNSSLVIFDG